MEHKFDPGILKKLRADKKHRILTDPVVPETVKGSTTVPVPMRRRRAQLHSVQTKKTI